MKRSDAFDEIARQVLAAAELETYLALDLLPSDPELASSNFIHEKLRARLFFEIDAIRKAGKTRIEAARADLRMALLDEINGLSLHLIQRAEKGFSHLGSSSVTFLINTGDEGGIDGFEPFYFEYFPFVNFHGDALAAALRIRANSPEVQLTALRTAHSRCELEHLIQSISYATALGEEFEPEMLRDRDEQSEIHRRFRKRLQHSVLNDVDDFYSAIEIGSFHPYALPIEIPKRSTGAELKLAAQAFGGIGSSLKFTFELQFSGLEPTVKEAQDARFMYESAGIGLRVLSAWIRAADVVDDRRSCSICYRHSSAISRCSVHATKKHETRIAGLGQRVRPHYEQRMLELSRVPAIRRRLGQSLSWSENANASMQAAADEAKLTPRSRARAIVLANQIRELDVVMNPAMKRVAGTLFRSILDVVRALERQPEPVGDREKRFRARQQDAMRELLSIKGFFRAWCGKGRYSPEINLTMLGFDRDHPVVKGLALGATIVPRALLEQRAWTEALQEFKESNLPSAGTILRLLRKTPDKKVVAAQLGIGLSTVYKILNRGGRPRKRNYFRS